MAIIVNPSWKSKKKEDIVKYKDEEYEIGSTAFSSVSEAAAAGNTSDLVIVDKKLTSPVKVKGEDPKAITGAATDVFKAVVKEAKSKDEKTETKTIKFSATAGGTASIKDTDAALAGFDKITAKNAGGIFQGGKQDVNYSSKTVTDSDKGIENVDKTTTRSSKATGSLAVTGKANDNRVNAAAAAIADPDMATDPVDAVKATFKAITGNDYNEASYVAATYASVNLKWVTAPADGNFNGSVITEKAVFKTSSTNGGEKTSENYSYSKTLKAGSGSAVVTDSTVGGLLGFKSVSVSVKTTGAAVSVGGKIENGNGSETYTLKTAYTDGKSYSYNYSYSDSSTLAKGSTLTIKGQDGNKVAVTGEINDFDTVNLTYADIKNAMESRTGTKKENVKIAVTDKKGTAALTFNGTSETNKTVGGKSLTATNTDFANGAKGFANITFKAGVGAAADKSFDAAVEKEKYTKKQTGTAVEGITNDKTKYAYNIGNSALDTALVSPDEAYTVDWTKKEEVSVGGTKFSASGAAGTYAGFAEIEGFKTVDLNNSGANTLKAGLDNESYVINETVKESFTPDKAYSKSWKTDIAGKVVGTATVKGKNVQIGKAEGFASVKVNGNSDLSVQLYGVNNDSNLYEIKTYKKSASESITIKAGKDTPIATKTKSWTESAKAATELDATNVTLSGSYKDLKKAKLTNAAGSGTFNNARDLDKKETKKITWNAEEISSTEATKVPADFDDEKVTSWDEKLDQKETVVGEFTLKNSSSAVVTALAVNNYKKADITLGTDDTATANFVNDGDMTQKKAVKRTVTATKRTQNYSDSWTNTAVGSLKITGHKDVTTLNVGSIGYASIELKDVKLTGANASAYATTTSVSATETATLDSGDVTAVTLKYAYTNNKSGNGFFKASFSDTTTVQQAFTGTLNGFGTVELKKTTVSFGDANNTKYVGSSGDSTTVAWNTDYFDVIGVNMGKTTATGETLAGNITGAYTLNKNGQIDSKWTGTYSTLAGGSFTQEAAKDGVTAGDITGYDKVTLSKTKSVGDVNGANQEVTRVLTYKVGKDGEATANSDVKTTKNTSSSAFSATGTDTQKTAITSINGYKTVELTNATASGTIIAVNATTVVTKDALTYDSTETVATADGSLTAKKSTLSDAVSGFQTVSLTDTEASVAFTGGSTYKLVNDKETKTLAEDKIAAGSFKAERTKDDKTTRAVGAVTGFQSVELKDYSAGAVAVEFTTADAKATSFAFTPADTEKETQDSWKKEAATKANTFSATASQDTTMAVTSVTGYNKVTATELKSIGAIANATIDDTVSFANRIYGQTHYGYWTSSAESTETGYTGISVTAGDSATIKGKNGGTQTAVTGNIAGYNNVTLDYAVLGTSGQKALYAGGKYTYTTTTKDDAVKATSTNTASGKLAISNAESAAADASFEVAGFQTVDIDLTKAATKATFTSIIGGTEQATFTGTTLDTVKYTTAGSLNLKVDKASASSVDGKVAGFTTMSFTDVNFAADGDILAYSIPSKDKKSVSASVTFNNNKDGANTIAGDISGAKEITFKSSTADASDDFTVTGKIESNKASAGTKIEGNTTVTFEKAQVSMAFANFDLDAGDVLAFFSETGADKTATLDLGDLDSAVLSNWEGVSLTGTGTVKFSGTVYADGDALKTALTAAKVNYDAGITFTK